MPKNELSDSIKVFLLFILSDYVYFTKNHCFLKVLQLLWSVDPQSSNTLYILIETTQATLCYLVILKPNMILATGINPEDRAKLSNTLIQQCCWKDSKLFGSIEVGIYMICAIAHKYSEEGCHCSVGSADYKPSFFPPWKCKATFSLRQR